MENNRFIPPTCLCQTGQLPGEHVKYKVEIASYFTLNTIAFGQFTCYTEYALIHHQNINRTAETWRRDKAHSSSP